MIRLITDTVGDGGWHLRRRQQRPARLAHGADTVANQRRGHASERTNGADTPYGADAPSKGWARPPSDGRAPAAAGSSVLNASAGRSACTPAPPPRPPRSRSSGRPDSTSRSCGCSFQVGVGGLRGGVVLWTCARSVSLSGLVSVRQAGRRPCPSGWPRSASSLAVSAPGRGPSLGHHGSARCRSPRLVGGPSAAVSARRRRSRRPSTRRRPRPRSGFGPHLDLGLQRGQAGRAGRR